MLNFATFWHLIGTMFLHNSVKYNLCTFLIKNALQLNFLKFRLSNMLLLGANLGSKMADNGRYYRPIISVSLADYRYWPISIFPVSVVHYSIPFHISTYVVKTKIGLRSGSFVYQKLKILMILVSEI